MVIKNKTIIKNSVQKKIKCEQEFGQINKICLGKSKFLSLENISGIPDYKDVIKFSIDDNPIKNIYLLSHNNNSFLSDHQIEFIVQIIKKTVRWIKNIFDIDNNTTFNLILMGSTAKKYFPEKEKPLTENNVNSADSTFFSTGDINIRIYRKEELIKVLIHETIHCTKVEKAVIPINNIYNVNGKLLLTEAVVEALATYINCMIYSELFNKNINDLIINEINFGILQTAKILDHFNFTSIIDFLENKNKKIIQKTAAFEYHILKTILLMNFDKMIELLKKNESLEKIITNELKNKEYQTRVNEHIARIKNLPENIKKTFRMTMTDIRLNDIHY
ncbi:hypothetical protein Indivirus_6_8 [Indivirus ILV1]|uniref:Uncharacterized protein n=1 Tax=Indivirus ILV1 TaxID=1977633 RepID=A0A1V0SE12_9VIRU|nr:hypothetical protein Indivirus_6_8 [Indivirus ILV1]